MAYKKDLVLSRKRKFLVISDLHIPYEDKNAIEKALTLGLNHQCNELIILGDMLDFHKVSKYRHSKSAVEVEDEIALAREWLMKFSWQFGKMYFVPGNHEARLSTYIIDNAPSLTGLDELRLDRLLGLEEYGCQFVEGFIHCGDMSFLHGHEFRIGGMDPARKLFGKMKKSAICGHLHRPDSYYTRDGAGNLLQCHVLGHLGESRPEYMPRNDWQHGCAIVTVPKSGKAQVQTYIL